MLNKIAFILLGNSNTGKTTFQKVLIEQLCLLDVWNRMECDIVYDIKSSKVKTKNIFASNSSFQEKANSKRIGKTSKEYIEWIIGLEKSEIEIIIISSRLVKQDVQEMIDTFHKNFVNVIGVFWTNSIEKDIKENQVISMLNWDKRIIIESKKMEIEKEDIVKKLKLQLKKEVAEIINCVVEEYKFKIMEEQND